MRETAHHEGETDDEEYEQAFYNGHKFGVRAKKRGDPKPYFNEDIEPDTAADFGWQDGIQKAYREN